MNFTIIEPEEFLKKIKEVVKNEIHDCLSGNETERLFTINQVAKRLGMSHSTVKKLVTSGQIKSTSNNRITEKAIDDFLQNK